MDREEHLERLLVSAIEMLDSVEDYFIEKGEEPDGFGGQRAALQIAYDAMR